MVSQIEPPTQPEVIYPDSDGQPMANNTIQFGWIVEIKQNLDWLFADNPNVFVDTEISRNIEQERQRAEQAEQARRDAIPRFNSELQPFCSAIRVRNSELRPFCSTVRVQNSELRPFCSTIRVQNSELRPFCSTVHVQNSEVRPFYSTIRVHNSKR